MNDFYPSFVISRIIEILIKSKISLRFDNFFEYISIFSEFSYNFEISVFAV